MNATVERIKVEILFDAPLAQAVAAIVTGAGATGYTLLPALGGTGRSGTWNRDGMSVADTKLLLLTIATEETAAKIVHGLEPLLDSHGMLVMISPVRVVRETRF